MNNIQKAFAKGKVFMPFITAGDPGLETTEELLHTLHKAGAGIIEIGIPFSDPIAEGPVIEAASARALSAGFTVDKLFDMVGRIRKDIPVPLLFMTYYNPIFAYGLTEFTDKCAKCGIDALIVPDLPFEERDELLAPCKASNIELISLIAPTSDERIEKIAKNSGGFLYCVSSLGVTGERAKLGGDAAKMIKKAKSAADIPCAVGFGISTPEQAKQMAQHADGVIIGSAIVRIVAEHGKNCIEPVRLYAESIAESLAV